MGYWSPGAWTPSRCELWRNFNDDEKARLMEWIEKERLSGTPHKTQLPPGYDTKGKIIRDSS